MEPERRSKELAECDEGLLLAVGIVGALVCALQLAAVLCAHESFGPGSTVALLVLGGCVWLIWDSLHILKRS